MIWSYKDKSNPDGHSRHLEWSLNLFVFRAKGFIGWNCWTFHFTLLQLFYFSWYGHMSCGRSASLRFVKWGLAGTLCRGWQTTVFIGIPQLMLTDWLLRRSIRRMPPEKREQFRETLRSALPKDEA